jgi:hypothetical protein
VKSSQHLGGLKVGGVWRHVKRLEWSPLRGHHGLWLGGARRPRSGDSVARLNGRIRTFCARIIVVVETSEDVYSIVRLL